MRCISFIVFQSNLSAHSTFPAYFHAHVTKYIQICPYFEPLSKNIMWLGIGTFCGIKTLCGLLRGAVPKNITSKRTDSHGAMQDRRAVNNNVHCTVNDNAHRLPQHKKWLYRRTFKVLFGNDKMKWASHICGQNINYELLLAIHSAWCMVHGAWCMVHGAWCMVHGAWCIRATGTLSCASNE